MMHAETTCTHIGASGRRAAIHELVGLLIKVIPEADPNELVTLFENREKFHSTMAFDGAALPFAELASIERPVIALATSLEGVEFAGPERDHTHLFIAIVTPKHKPGLIAQLLARLTRLFRAYPDLARRLAPLEEADELRGRFAEFESTL